MAKLVECIPNFSEGRDEAVLAALTAVGGSVPGVSLLHVQKDASHNRSVFTLIGSPVGMEEAAFLLCQKAMETIDLTRHQGVHPRMGATDVIPFVPIRDMTIQECAALSKRVAKRIWEELHIPSFLYEASAASPERMNLAALRKGEFEGMPEKLRLPEWAPDYGERKIHPTAGITAIGARMPLIAFNVNLDTDHLKIAQAIARIVRGSSGGFRDCKALGVMLKERNIAQVTMNMVNYEGTPLYRVFETIRMEAERWGVNIIGTEIVGMTPAKALLDAAEYYLKIENFDADSQVLEYHLIGE